MAAAAAAVIVCAIVVAIVMKWRGDGTTAANDPEVYRQAVSAFYVGVIAMEVDNADLAVAQLTRATELAPEEPATWADLGLFYVRKGDYVNGRKNLDKARSLSPPSAEVEMLAGLLEGLRGDFDKAIGHFRAAADLDPRNLRARYALATAVERRGGPEADAEARKQINQIVEVAPTNLAVLLEAARLAAKANDAPALRDVIDRIEKLSEGWPPEPTERLNALMEVAKTDNVRAAGPQVLRLRNLLVRLPAFRQSVAAVETAAGRVGEPIERFLKLPAPSPNPAPPDDKLALSSQPLGTGDTKADAVVPAWLGRDEPATIFLANADQVWRADGKGRPLPFPSGAAKTPPSADGVLPIDFENSFKTGLVLAGAGGVRVFKQTKDGAGFEDITDKAIADEQIRAGDYYGAWAADFDTEGDLDVVLARRSGPPVVLRNNGDGTFAIATPFGDVAELRGFAWADLDGEGTGDAVLLDAQCRLTVLLNERGGRFRKRDLPADMKDVVAITIADVTRRGRLEVVALAADRSIVRVFDDATGSALKSAKVASSPGATSMKNESVRLNAADVDLNGAVDLIPSGMGANGLSVVLLGDATAGQFTSPARAVADRIVAVYGDANAPGGISLLGLSTAGQPVRVMATRTKPYHHQIVRPRANEKSLLPGDNRINAYGIGGEMDLRAGLLYQKQPIAGGAVHFGIGEHAASDAIRIVWPNGQVQGEFALKADASVLAEQRLKGSCPMLFTNDGKEIVFVTDLIWRSPLGLRINAQDTAQAMQTEDWVRVRGDQLKPTADGYYDLRVTAELWETHYFDHVSLMTVDHPAGTEVYVDERFAVPQPPLKVFVTSEAKPFAGARDDQGRDVAANVAARDGNHLGGFALGRFQGVGAEHWVEIELPVDAPADAPLVLIGSGWINPTDSSINVAMSQGDHPRPSGLVMEVPDGEGNWRVAKDGLGFPAGKNKTVVLPLDGVFEGSPAPRRLRLRTNLEVYWDRLAWAVIRDDKDLVATRLAAHEATLRYRGFSVIEAADGVSPEVPQYDRMMGSDPRWFDLEGFYTRFGDVRELLDRVDDRYVIMNAGDEMRLRFAPPPPPGEGRVRDFVVIADGWEKDGDFNTAFSRTVLPLPRHDWPAYDRMPESLEDDPAYQRNPGDWEKYHTRYVAPEGFGASLRPREQ